MFTICRYDGDGARWSILNNKVGTIKGFFKYSIYLGQLFHFQGCILIFSINILELICTLVNELAVQNISSI